MVCDCLSCVCACVRACVRACACVPAYLLLQSLVLLLHLPQQGRLPLPRLDLGTQLVALGLQLGHPVPALLQQRLHVLDLLVLVPQLTQHLLQVVLWHTGPSGEHIGVMVVTQAT